MVWTWTFLLFILGERVLFIGTQFSNLYTTVDTPARGCVVVCLVFVCQYVLGHSRDSQPLNLWLCLLRHLGFLTSTHASPTCSRRRLNSYRLLRRSTPGPPPILWAHHQEKTCEVITPYGVITQFPKNGRLFTPKYRPDHTINMWSHRQNFVHTINFQDHTDIILLTPSRCYSHSWNFGSHHLNFVHTINSQDHTAIILFTPSRC